MDYKLCAKNHLGKWWSYGNIKTNQYGKEQASFKLADLEALVKLHKDQGKEWVNLAMFPAEDKYKDHAKAKGNAYQEDSGAPF